jgi:pSer/pThr/pTyr-binding forkhead associated (FHA) protein
MFKLVIQDDEGKTTVVPLIRDEITIGRKEGNTIRLTERNVSRRHARILRNNGEVQIEDLGSYNGIRVNNARIAERVSLRVSDQVQIGDYKLYLKAEGVEQVDDARTMPIERIDGAATEQMAAVPPSSPTVPIPAQAIAAAAAAAPGAAARSLGTADTDPNGRPVATAAQVAALSQTAAYGKLVVVSSNYAGKEFDLTRPQMIVGRTAENDIVVDHRSISRNHAKVTRDPETGRYTISDLQSSNGVRVNGQDYGKVELRRDDVIDLGHVRLRYVEPGQDFVFARDARIEDVPEAGARKGLMIAIALGVLLLASVAVFFVLNSSKKEDTKKTDGTNLASGSNVASGSEINPGSNAGVAPGSNTAVVAADLDAGVAGMVGSNDEAGQTKIQCLEYLNAKKWQDLLNCADKLAKFDPKKAKELGDKAHAEQANQLALDNKLDDAIKAHDLTAAKKALDSIDDDSVYKKTAQDRYNGLESDLVEQYKESAIALKRGHRCGELDALAQKAQEKGGARAAEAVRAVHCEAVAVNPTGDHTGPKNPVGAGSGSSTTTQTQAPCDADALKDQGMKDEEEGHYGQALSVFESALRCKADARGIQLAFMASCNAGNVPKAKLYYKKLSADNQGRFVVMCIRRNITKETLEAP